MKLADEEEKRKELVRKHFLMQNKVNKLQSDVNAALYIDQEEWQRPIKENGD